MQPDAATPSVASPSADGSNTVAAEWWGILLRQGESSPPEVIASLRSFVGRAIQRGFGGRRDCDEAFIEDMTQEATLRVLKSLGSFRGDSLFTTWATTVAIRVAFNEMRRARWKDVSLTRLLERPDGGSTSKYEPASEGDGPERGAIREELFGTLKQLIERDLTGRQRQAIEAELAGMPLAELAEKMQTNSNALYKLIHDARKKLKQGLLETGVTEQDVRSALNA